MIADEMQTNASLEGHLKTFFGYNEFRDYQKDIVTALLEHRDVLAILPTGAGKSICYQLPALLMPGIAIVVSPLISLMQDQVISLTKNGLPAAFLNSSVHPSDIRTVMNNLSDYKLLYVAPERLLDKSFLAALQQHQASVSFFAIDEAHCISQWGHAFRPEYRQLAILKETFPKSAIIALTATATNEVEEDIATQLKMAAPFKIRASFDRPNLTISIRSKSEPFTQAREFIDKHPNQAGIIYASTRKTVDETYEKLSQRGYQVGKYHAGMVDTERATVQHAFVHGQLNLMVATVAFGMGIHKPDIRYIIHLDMPRTIEQYYQEIGRAGRDGLPSECLMLFATKDLMVYNSFLKDVTDEKLRQLTKAKTDKMYALCQTLSCRRKELLRYFGEKYALSNCNSCDNCTDETDLVDESLVAKKILSCVARLQQRYGVKYVIDVLRGSNSKTIHEREHHQLSTYGLMKEYPENDLRFYIEALLQSGFLKKSDGEYPVLQWSDASKDVISGKSKAMLRKQNVTQTRLRQTIEEKYDTELFSILVQLRKKWAIEQGVPSFVIFGDRPLIEMSTTFPTTSEEFLSISGVGPIKWEKYGESFLEAIKSYCSQHEIKKPPKGAPKFIVAKEFIPTDSSAETLRLYRAGNQDLVKLAHMRKMAPGTVIQHLVDQIAVGEVIDITPLVPIHKQDVIRKLIIALDYPKMKPIKEALPEEYSYNDIRLVMAIHQQKKD